MTLRLIDVISAAMQILWSLTVSLLLLNVSLFGAEEPFEKRVRSILEVSTFIASLPEFATYRNWEAALKTQIVKDSHAARHRQAKSHCPLLDEYHQSMCASIGRTFDSLADYYRNHLGLDGHTVLEVFHWDRWNAVFNDFPEHQRYVDYRTAVLPNLRALVFDAYAQLIEHLRQNKLKPFAVYQNSLDKLALVFAWLWPDSTSAAIGLDDLKKRPKIVFKVDHEHAKLFDTTQSRNDFVSAALLAIKLAKETYPTISCDAEFREFD